MLETMDGSTPVGRGLQAASVINPEMRPASTGFPAMSAVFMSSCRSANHSKTSPWRERSPPSSDFGMERRPVVQLALQLSLQIQHHLLESAHFCTGTDRLWCNWLDKNHGPELFQSFLTLLQPLDFGCTLDVELFDPLLGTFDESFSCSDRCFQRHLQHPSVLSSMK